MKTLLISDNPPPRELRDVIARGSTAVHERRASDVSAEAVGRLDVDRIVFWAAGGGHDSTIKALAHACAAAERAQRREAIVFVTPQGTNVHIDGLSPNELFEWPRDEDRLKMAFMTGA
jgi:hypothetical protein